MTPDTCSWRAEMGLLWIVMFSWAGQGSNELAWFGDGSPCSSRNSPSPNAAAYPWLPLCTRTMFSIAPHFLRTLQPEFAVIVKTSLLLVNTCGVCRSLPGVLTNSLPSTPRHLSEPLSDPLCERQNRDLVSSCTAWLSSWVMLLPHQCP